MCKWWFSSAFSKEHHRGNKGNDGREKKTLLSPCNNHWNSSLKSYRWHLEALKDEENWDGSKVKREERLKSQKVFAAVRNKLQTETGIWTLSLVCLGEASSWNHRRSEYVSHSSQLSFNVFSPLWAVSLFRPQRVYIIHNNTVRKNRPDAWRPNDKHWQSSLNKIYLITLKRSRKVGKVWENFV